MDVEAIIVIELEEELEIELVVVVVVGDITFDEVDGITRGTAVILKEYYMFKCMQTVTVLLIIIH